MSRSIAPSYFVLGFFPLILAASVASAASDISNSFTGFTGNSTQGGTQTAISGAGFNFFDHLGDSQVQFDSSGAHFGEVVTGDPGRNYVRTNEMDYANVSFVAEITMIVPDIENQDGYFGLGPGDAEDVYRTPGYITDPSAVMFWGETDFADPYLQTMRNHNSNTQFFFTSAPAMNNGTHRLRLSYDWFAKTMTVSVDAQYAGGPFVADYAVEPVNTRPLYGATGWPDEAARIFFGGDEGVTFKDLAVDVTTGEMLMGDFNSSGTITEADWSILRDNMHTNLSSLTLAQAFFLGDLTGDKKNNHDDFIAFKLLYEEANGSGSFERMLAGVPEPSTLFLFAMGFLPSGFVRRRPVNRHKLSDCSKRHN